MQQSEQVGALAEAIAKAQAEMQNAVKDATNPHFKSKYATLASVVDASVRVLARHGVATAQSCEVTEAGVNCITQLTHAVSGQWQRGSVLIPVAGRTAQAVVSACTYARRTGLAAAACIAADDDDDGNAASGGDNKKRDEPKPDLAQQARTKLGARFQDNNEGRRDFVQTALGRLPSKEEPMTEAEAATVLAALEER